MKVIDNPYKDAEEKKVLHVTVSDEDWMYVHLAHPFRGLQDQILSFLFHQFVTKLRTYNLSKHYEPKNRKIIAAVLRGDAPSRDNGSGHYEVDRSGEARARFSDSRKAAISPEATLCA